MSVGLLVWGPYQGAAKAKFPYEITKNRGDWHLLNQLTSSEIGCLATRSLWGRKKKVLTGTLHQLSDQGSEKLDSNSR